MPQSVPWFDNQLDPTLPVDPNNPGQSNLYIKCPLYYYDEYQTYDGVFVGEIHHLLSRVNFPYSFPLNFPTGQPVNFPLAYDDEDIQATYKNRVETPFCILFERYTPFEFPWCDNYSTQIYNWIRKYTGTRFSYEVSKLFDFSTFTYVGNSPANGHLKIDYLSNLQKVDINFGNEFEGHGINYSQWITKDKLLIKLPKTDKPETINITWFAKDERTREYGCLSKRYKQLVTSTSGATEAIITSVLDIYKNAEGETVVEYQPFVVCSMVISGKNTALVNQVKGQIPGQYFYESLGGLLDYIDNEINRQFPYLFLVPNREDISLRASGCTHTIGLPERETTSHSLIPFPLTDTEDTYYVDNNSSVYVGEGFASYLSEAFQQAPFVFVSAASGTGYTTAPATVELTSIVSHTQKPDDYYYASIQYANNNYWQNGKHKPQDSGKPARLYQVSKYNSNAPFPGWLFDQGRIRIANGSQVYPVGYDPKFALSPSELDDAVNVSYTSQIQHVSSSLNWLFRGYPDMDGPQVQTWNTYAGVEIKKSYWIGQTLSGGYVTHQGDYIKFTEGESGIHIITGNTFERQPGLNRQIPAASIYDFILSNNSVLAFSYGSLSDYIEVRETSRHPLTEVWQEVSTNEWIDRLDDMHYMG